MYIEIHTYVYVLYIISMHVDNYYSYNQKFLQLLLKCEESKMSVIFKNFLGNADFLIFNNFSLLLLSYACKQTWENGRCIVMY